MTDDDQLRHDAEKEAIEEGRDAWIEGNMSELMTEFTRLEGGGDFEQFCTEKWEEYLKGVRDNDNA